MPLKPSFAILLFWEYLQNLPPALGFFLGFSYFQRDDPAGWLFALAGGLLGALVIRYTESFMDPGPRESWTSTGANAVFFASGTLLAIFYFDNRWGIWWIDAAIGVVAGGALALSQGWAAGTRIDARHLGAMAAALALGLPATRYLLLFWPPLLGALAICLVVSVSIVAIGYRAD